MKNITPDQPETSQPQLQKANPAALLTKGQLATLLNCSLRTVHDLIALKAIAHVRIGRAVRIRPKAVEDFFVSRTVSATTPLSMQSANQRSEKSNQTHN
jgi:excisionase family DNA binding protein